MELTKVNDLYDTWLTGDGIFTDLNVYDVPWKQSDTVENLRTIASLNYTYHGNHSGEKNISPLVYKFIKSEVEQPRYKLATAIYTMFGDKWEKLWDAINAEYDPLNNYDMTETEETHGTNRETLTKTGTNTTTMTGTDTNAKTGTETLNMTGTDTHAKTGTETLNMTGTDTTNHTGNTENEVSAFNSSSYVDNSKDTQNTTDAETRNMSDATTYNTTDAETRNMSDATTFNTTNLETRNMTDTETRNTTDTTSGGNDEARTLTRSGNIGVTTNQQMLQSEIELRKWNFFLSVFNDIDSMLTLSIY